MKTDDQKWYQGITRYQWLVLLIASLGWIFDVFEGQIFVASMREAMSALLPDSSQSDRALYNNISLASFLLGGAVGGVLFGVLSDRIGRTRTMILTILMYSLFSCVTALAQTWWHMAGLRFLVAMGVGGEWAVASALVAEVVPERARARFATIFHASSVFGTYLAVAAGMWIVRNPALGWRWGFAIGAIPALLTLWIRWSLKEPERWVKAKEQEDPGRISELFSSDLLRRTVVGVSLAAIGMATFWGVHIYGKDVARQMAETRIDMNPPSDLTAAELKTKREDVGKQFAMFGMFMTTTGGGIGLLCFGPICERIGRRSAFALYHIGGVLSAVVLFALVPLDQPWAVWSMLPIFGFLTLGMHAGYAVYFPEMYPTRLRSTGAGFCFNVGRILAAPMLILTGYLQSTVKVSVTTAGMYLSLLYLTALIVLVFAPETKGQRLMD